jgi:signal transduction histidine kinase
VALFRGNITRLIEGMSGAIVVLLTVAIPGVYFVIGWESQSTHLQTTVDIHAQQISNVIARNPEMWKYETIRLGGILSDQPGGKHLESSRILAEDGSVVAQSNETLPWPIMTRSHPLMDSGEIVGSMETSASLRPLFVESSLLALIGAVLSAALFFLVRVYPLSELRNALDLLSREKRHAKVTLHSIGDGVISTDSEGRVLIINRAAAEMTGWPQAEAAGRPIGEVYRLEGNHLVGRDESMRLIEAGASPILQENGRSIGTVHVFRDVTEQVRTLEELHKVQKLESLGILAAGIAHEIRNPLSAINISLSSIQHVCSQSLGLEPEIRGKIRLVAEQMNAAATKIATVVQRVMDFSKPIPPRMALADLNRVISEAIGMSSSTLRKRGIAVYEDLAPDLPPCRVDAALIEQVLINLITNAYQALESTDGSKFIEIASTSLDGRIVVRVSDSGPGVPQDIRGKIFDPFFTTRKDGSGIGLAFSHRIVNEHGGTLRLDTSKWGGAEFRIELPLSGEGIPA